jgi:hypothetical protein
MYLPKRDPDALFHHYKLAGHLADVTAMAMGGYRCECACGWFNDMATLDEARKLARHHIDSSRRQQKRDRDNASRRQRRAA